MRLNNVVHVLRMAEQAVVGHNLLHDWLVSGSHVGYRGAEPLKTTKFLDPTDNSMLVEVRSDDCQTVFPPSTHPSGETYEFHSDGDPATIAGDKLLRAVTELAGLALLAKHWPSRGSRQQAAIALASALLRAENDVARCLGSLYRDAG